jgi:hypothetical protein
MGIRKSQVNKIVAAHKERDKAFGRHSTRQGILRADAAFQAAQRNASQEEIDEAAARISRGG